MHYVSFGGIKSCYKQALLIITGMGWSGLQKHYGWSREDQKHGILSLLFVLASWLVLGNYYITLFCLQTAASFVFMIPNNSYFIFYFQGNRLFKEGKFELAKAKYEKAIYSARTLFTLCLMKFFHKYSIEIISQVITRCPRLFVKSVC